MLPQPNNRRFRRPHLRLHQAQHRRNSLVMSEDTKSFVIAGYKVTLHFRQSLKGDWMVKGTVSSGEQDQKRTTTFEVNQATSRDAAESLALKKAGQLMGNNVPAIDQQNSEAGTPKLPPGIQ